MVGSEQILRRLVEENKVTPEATRVRTTTRSIDNEWCRAQAMKLAWNDEEKWYRTREETSAETDSK